MDKSLNNIKEIKLKIFQNKKGNILRGFRKSKSIKFPFSEIYFSRIKYNKIKGWKYHTKMTMELFVPIGKVKFIFFDENKEQFKEIIIGEKNYKKIIVPPKIWFSFKGLSKIESLVVNMADIIHRKKESKNIPLNKIKYKFK